MNEGAGGADVPQALFYMLNGYDDKKITVGLVFTTIYTTYLKYAAVVFHMTLKAVLVKCYIPG